MLVEDSSDEYRLDIILNVKRQFYKINKIEVSISTVII